MCRLIRLRTSKRGGGSGDTQYGLFLGLTSGKELGVWYKTEEQRKAAYTKKVRKRNERENNRACSGRGGKGTFVPDPVCDARPVLDWRGIRFEGIVHESRVDGVVLAWLCWLIVGEIEQFERKIGGDRR